MDNQAEKLKSSLNLGRHKQRRILYLVFRIKYKMCFCLYLPIATKQEGQKPLGGVPMTGPPVTTTLLTSNAIVMNTISIVACAGSANQTKCGQPESTGRARKTASDAGAVAMPTMAKEVVSAWIPPEATQREFGASNSLGLGRAPDRQRSVPGLLYLY